ncbi:hypothetical protein TWF106_010952 [Orbilia oligospora]|uniref:Carbohydrate kinase PfkB domain-containing protein n=1 Tax=Orbilia oligospora TaxID=2813651 RepID=A0A7C8URT9_ORBOL|nr:hypothetical protein TWF106_010952 [Orbilia oligospora]
MAAREIMFATFGMVILDTIYFKDDWNDPICDSLGGSGTYSTLGARLFCAGENSTSIGWVTRLGSDFPDSILETLKSWNTTLHVIRERPATTRGHLRYLDTTLGSKTFRHTQMPLWTLPEHFLDTQQLSSKTFHFLARHGEIFRDVPKLLAIREDSGITERPKIIWEPFPATCTPKFLKDYMKAVKLVDVFSPNHMELNSFFGVEVPEIFERGLYEGLARKFLDKGIGKDGKGCLVLRAGEHGCMVFTREMERPHWLPTYYEVGNEKVVDTTGAGNSFLGGFAIGLVETGDVIEAAKYGTVAASFVIEQMGVANITRDADGTESWNGEDVRSRLAVYNSRIA